MSDEKKNKADFKMVAGSSSAVGMSRGIAAYSYGSFIKGLASSGVDVTVEVVKPRDISKDLYRIYELIASSAAREISYLDYTSEAVDKNSSGALTSANDFCENYDLSAFHVGEYHVKCTESEFSNLRGGTNAIPDIRNNFPVYQAKLLYDHVSDATRGVCTAMVYTNESRDISRAHFTSCIVTVNGHERCVLTSWIPQTINDEEVMSARGVWFNVHEHDLGVAH